MDGLCNFDPPVLVHKSTGGANDPALIVLQHRPIPQLGQIPLTPHRPVVLEPIGRHLLRVKLLRRADQRRAPGDAPALAREAPAVFRVKVLEDVDRKHHVVVLVGHGGQDLQRVPDLHPVV